MLARHKYSPEVCHQPEHTNLHNIIGILIRFKEVAGMPLFSNNSFLFLRVRAYVARRIDECLKRGRWQWMQRKVVHMLRLYFSLWRCNVIVGRNTWFSSDLLTYNARTKLCNPYLISVYVCWHPRTCTYISNSDSKQLVSTDFPILCTQINNFWPHCASFTILYNIVVTTLFPHVLFVSRLDSRGATHISSNCLSMSLLCSLSEQLVIG